MTTQATRAQRISEAQWQQRICDLAQYLGLRVFHSGDSRRDSSAGYPDLTIVGPGGIVWAELKSADGRIRPEQVRWIEALRNAGAEAHIWRPEQWPEVSQRLRRLAGRAA